MCVRGGGHGCKLPRLGYLHPGGVVGQAAQATVSYPHPFLFREKRLMVHFMIIEMSLQ